MMQQLSNSTNYNFTSMYFFTHHYTLYLSIFLLLLPTPRLLNSPLLIQMSQPHHVQGLLYVQYRHQSSRSTYTAQTLLLIYTGYTPLLLKATTQNRLPSSIYIHPQTVANIHKLSTAVLKTLCTLFSWALIITTHTQEMLLHALATTHPSTSRLLHQHPECSRCSL